MHRITLRTLAVAGVLLAILALAACADGNKRLNDQRKQSLNARSQAFARAEAAVPIPVTENFPLRRTLVEMTKRDDMLNHPWFVYILGFNGNIIGYYVAKTDPVNACNFLSSTEDEHRGDAGVSVLTAPSLDGMFYGGGGTSAGCDAWVFLDQATNALVKIRGLAFYVADQPLRVEAKPIRVK
jgi:hypothetical protein